MEMAGEVSAESMTTGGTSCVTLPSESIDNIRKEFHEISNCDKKRDGLIQALLNKSTEMANDIHRLSIDLEDQIRSRIQYQECVHKLEELNRQLQHSLDKDSYVVILIDGDGAKFLDGLLCSSNNGAEEAAQNIRRHIKDYLKDTPLGLRAHEVPIVARVFANIRGLSKSLYLSGAITTENDMYMFAENFTNSRADFDFINVGYGKENADSKMRSMLRFFYKDRRCQKIFFVACHDSGYVHELREHQGHPGALERIVLVETTPAHPAFLRLLGFPITRFEDVFSKKPLQIESGYTMPQQTKSNANPVPASSKTQRPRRHIPKERMTNSKSGDTSNGCYSNYTGVEKAMEHEDTGVQTDKTIWTKTIEFNSAGKRLDPLITAPVNTSAYETYRHKSENIKPRQFCNGFYINGRCGRRSRCAKEHDMDLSAEEIAILRYKARTSMCQNGPGCTMFVCCLGHHCPDILCNREDCKFRHTKFGDMHLEKTDLEPTAKWIASARDGHFTVPVKRIALS